MTVISSGAVERPFSVLFVCTANQCRSPISEVLFRATIRRLGLDWVVSSAGVHGRDGAPMHPHASTVLEERNLQHDGWKGRRLNATSIAAADLVLTAELAHRHTIVTMQPSAVRYSFTLLQFSKLLTLSDVHDDHASDETGPGLIRHAELARSRPQSRDQHLLDLADPIGQSIDKFRNTASRIEEALQVIERALRPIRADTPT